MRGHDPIGLVRRAAKGFEHIEKRELKDEMGLIVNRI
jgi:hypothetical protein